ncbi:cellulose binding domain-containing protein [Dactylosporangium salmoneum]|uniref:histidine kinase n=1 Tax=Dactylosporangium salmoneum TaxID=53361 RepID=A0ABN3HEK4_9ACTN
MGDHLRLRLGGSLLAAGLAAAAAATVLPPLPAALALVLAAGLAGGLLGWPGALFAVPLLLFADGPVAKVAVGLAGVLPFAALLAWRRRAARGERIRAAAAAAERARLAREMHDSLSKTLDAIALGAAALPDSLDEPDRASRLAATLRDGSREAARDARGLIDDLRASPADAPLPDLVAAITQEWSAQTGVGVILHSAGLEDAEADPASPAALELCWILREALRNVAAHARAETVAVTLGRDGDSLALEVRDDGAGFAVPDNLAHLQRDGHHGIVGMHERARNCGGQLSIWSRPGGGTRVTATVPAAVAGGPARPSGWIRLIAAGVAVVVPLAIVAFLARPDGHTTPLAESEPQLTLDPRATHRPTTPGAAPASPGRTASAATSPAGSRSASARPSASGSAPAAPGPTGGTTVAETRTCKVVYVKRSEWDPGFVADVTLTNTGSSKVDGWSLRFDYPAGQKLLSYWNVVASQDGVHVTVGPDGNHVVLAPGAAFTFGLQGTWKGSNPNPAAFTLNGAPCG